MANSAAKESAANRAVDDILNFLSKSKTEINSDFIIGIGSGSTVVYVVERLALLYHSKEMSIKACIPSSFQATQLIIQAGLPLASLNEHPVIHVAFDGADEVDLEGNCIKGGGGCLLQEKLVISNAQKWFIVADYTKDSDLLGKKWTKGVPLEVLPMAYKSVSKKLEKLGGIVSLRMAANKAGPVVTDNAMFLLDTVFPPARMRDPSCLDAALQGIPGLVETGLFCGLADGCYFGMEDGSVKVVDFSKFKI